MPDKYQTAERIAKTTRILRELKAAHLVQAFDNPDGGRGGWIVDVHCMGNEVPANERVMLRVNSNEQGAWDALQKNLWRDEPLCWKVVDYLLGQEPLRKFYLGYKIKTVRGKQKRFWGASTVTQDKFDEIDGGSWGIRSEAIAEALFALCELIASKETA